MSKQRRTFSPEFKQQAACLVLDQGYSHMEASRSVGVGETVLCRWVQQLQMERQGVTPQGKAISPDQQRIQELEARIERLEREKAILKKATALLMSEGIERTKELISLAQANRSN
ncbi:transposase [Paraburkholderia tropica]|nr:transposase [Paraburkholderia tropica]